MATKLDLTSTQLDLYNHLKEIPGAILRTHKAPRGKKCFRLLDEYFNPIKNYPEKTVLELEEKDLIERDSNQCFILKKEIPKKDLYKNIGLVKDNYEDGFTPIPKRNF